MTHPWRITGRALLAALLFAGGVASWVYGGLYHTAPVERNTLLARMVQVEHEEERELPFGVPFSPAPPEGSPFPDPGMGPSPDGLGFAPPPFPGEPRRKVKVIVTSEVEKKFDRAVIEYEPEPILVAEVTVGGVAMTQSGIVRRTYGPRASGEDIPRPTLCPT